MAACMLLGLIGTGPGSGSGAGDRAPDPSAAGLSASLHGALVRSGAFGPHPVRLLLLGDSIALTLGIGLAEGAPSAYGVAISNRAALGCDLDPTLEISTFGQGGPATQGCSKWRALWPYMVASIRPEVVALGMGRWEVSDHYYQGHWVHIGQSAWDDHLTADLRHAIAIFRTSGAKVVLLTMPYIHPRSTQPDGRPWPEDTTERTRAYNALIDRFARGYPGDVEVLNLNKMLSPRGSYTSKVDGVRVRWIDGIHVTVAGGELLQPQILPVIDRLSLQVEAAARHAR